MRMGDADSSQDIGENARELLREASANIQQSANLGEQYGLSPLDTGTLEIDARGEQMESNGGSATELGRERET